MRYRGIVSSARPVVRPFCPKRARSVSIASVKKSLDARTILGLALFALLSVSAFLILVYAWLNYQPPVERHGMRCVEPGGCLEQDDAPRGDAWGGGGT